MDKMIDVPAFTHILKLNDRKNIIIKGENLEMIKLDTLEGNVSIKGKINSFSYTDTITKDNSLLMKLFK